jgi:hypothetical protein
VYLPTELTECFKIVQDEDEEIYYDRKKSFFDNISCEAVERSKGLVNIFLFGGDGAY